jgi:choline kinase
MQAVILAAGAATRLRPLTDTTPKCLLKVGSKSLLQLTMENILANGINDFVFVTGYLNNMIEDFVRKNFPELNCKFLINSDYENNNNSYSLWMTREVVRGPILLLDSDILFDKGIISELLNCGKDSSLAVNFTHELDEEQMKVMIDEVGNVIKIGKKIPIRQSVGESIGIEVFSSYFVKELYAILNRKIIEQNIVNEFYETSFQEMIDRGPGRNSIYAADVSRYMCMEIDTIEDYNKAQLILNNNE